MSNRRIELNNVLESLLGTKNVYFQPPSTVKMHYPCIVYARSAMDTKHANNEVYANRQCYSVTVVDPNPDSPILERLTALPFCRFDRHYTADNLNHDVYSIYY